MAGAAFHLPTAVRVQGAGRWWRLRPSRVRAAARVGGALPWWTLGRQAEAPLLPALDLEDPRWPVTGSYQQPVLWGVDRWDRATWAEALEHMDMREERFALQGMVFDVVRAKSVVVSARLPIHQGVPTEAWWRGQREGIQVSEERLEELDLADPRPVLFVTLAARGAPPFRVLIDGNHRATAALLEAVEIPYAVIPLHLTSQALDPCAGTTTSVRRALRSQARRVRVRPARRGPPTRP